MNVVEERTPKRCNRIALTNRVGADEGGAKILPASEVGGFLGPRGNIIEVAGVLPAVENAVDVGFLRGVHDSRAHERRITDDVGRD